MYNKESDKIITLRLFGGVMTGIVKSSPDFGPAIAYKIPRSDFSMARNHRDLKQNGIYFLFGGRENREFVYVGQAAVRKNGNAIVDRIRESHPKIDAYWSEAVTLTSNTKEFFIGRTELSYLENRFCNMAKEAGRLEVLNGNEPPIGSYDEATKIKMDKFIECALPLIESLGYKVFVPLIDEKKEIKEKEIKEIKKKKYQKKVTQKKEIKKKGIKQEKILHMVINGCQATGQYKYTSGGQGFVVLKGSAISPQIHPSCSVGTRRLRNENADKIRDGRLIEDILFTSPSAAASFVAGSPQNGNKAWKGKINSPNHKVFIPLLSLLANKKDVVRVTMTINGYRATGQQTNDGFVIFKGSEISPYVHPSGRPRVSRLREKYSNKIRDGRLIEDILFTSPSAAASFVAGSSQNGRLVWKKGNTQ